MFASSRPKLVSLFSSTGTNPLQLFSCRTDPNLPTDSFIHLLHDASSNPPPPRPVSILALPSLHSAASAEANHQDNDVPKSGYALDHTVLHLQSPTIRTTYIRCPPFRAKTAENNHPSSDLALTLPCMHVQVRNLAREWALEVGVVDRSGRRGIIRCSTFQKEPRLSVPNDEHGAPLLHLPLAFPSRSAGQSTMWATFTLHLPTLLTQFSVLARTSAARGTYSGASSEDEDGSTARNLAPLPTGMLSHTSYVKVYATCRLRRIWFSEGTADQNFPWEFRLYAAE